MSGLEGVGVFGVCFFRGWVFPIVLLAWLVSSYTRRVTYVSSSLVRTYVRRDLASVSACYWVWVRVGMRPW